MVTGQMVGDLCFCVGRWILAFKYFKIAKNTPRIINSTEPPKQYDALFYTLLALNILFPCFEGITEYMQVRI